MTGPLEKQVQKYLQENPGSHVLDIAEDLDADPYEVAETLTNLRDQGQAQQEPAWQNPAARAGWGQPEEE